MLLCRHVGRKKRYTQMMHVDDLVEATLESLEKIVHSFEEPQDLHVCLMSQVVTAMLAQGWGLSELEKELKTIIDEKRDDEARSELEKMDKEGSVGIPEGMEHNINISSAYD